MGGVSNFAARVWNEIQRIGGYIWDGITRVGGYIKERIPEIGQAINLVKDAREALEILRGGKELIYSMIAPAFLGQFSDTVTPGKLRGALKTLGFTGMVEVSLFADILTLIEALEFERNIKGESDFMLTSCCCPMWMSMLRKNN